MPDKMCVRRYLGFVLLVGLQGVLHGQTSEQPCSAPSLDGGYWVPKRDLYNHETKLPYSCDKGRKPAVEGWWATSTCLNGNWSPKPQCIDDKACTAADIANAKYTETPESWYEDGQTIRITCNEGYVLKGRNDEAECNNGKWSSVPVCEKSLHVCGEPPQIPHAVIRQGYQDLFAAYTELQYECEEGYSVEGADTKASINCIDGNWKDGPVCSKWDTELGAGLVAGLGVDVGAGGRQPEVEASSCSVDTDQYDEFKSVGVRNIAHGEQLYLECEPQPGWYLTHYSRATCDNGRVIRSRCCSSAELQFNVC
ncbi:complement factor H-like isoform X1 [Pseudoliparis swirei]|uniref:complement factor H-like isoform X1 n=1 Tax=Pseudoliparis swirei TaxID=2059687 RepID=UPI0024BEFE5B|nr:complement factor H-like isoform X1 [Pseudoliparis swirei]